MFIVLWSCVADVLPTDALENVLDTRSIGHQTVQNCLKSPYCISLPLPCLSHFFGLLEYQALCPWFCKCCSKCPRFWNFWSINLRTASAMGVWTFCFTLGVFLCTPTSIRFFWIFCFSLIAYPNLLRTERLCCCCSSLFMMLFHW